MARIGEYLKSEDQAFCLLLSLFILWGWMLWQAGKRMGDDGP